MCQLINIALAVEWIQCSTGSMLLNLFFLNPYWIHVKSVMENVHYILVPQILQPSFVFMQFSHIVTGIKSFLETYDFLHLMKFTPSGRNYLEVLRWKKNVSFSLYIDRSCETETYI